MGFHSLVNTQYFREAALDFKKNKGMYTRAPRGSREYKEYWAEQDKRCIYGFSTGDLWIPGKLYFFLNFTRMLRIPDEDLHLLRQGKDFASITKKLDFPSFTEVHYEWANLKHLAWFGGEWMGIKSRGGQHVCALKTRRAGWSYYEAAEGAYNYNFIPGSKSYFFAGLEEYLTKDGIMNKVQADLDWINEHSPWWRKNRQMKNTLMHMKASYKNSRGDEEGFRSEILGLVVNDPDKVRGKNGIKITYEEGGSFRSLFEAYGISRGTVEDSGGSISTGQITVLGTGGEEGPDIEGLSEMWENPGDYNMLELPNIWEPGMDNEQVGYFVPVQRMNYKHMDSEGNVDIDESFMEEVHRRSKIKNKKVLDRRKAEYPIYPSEALMRTKSDMFWTERIDKQLKLCRSGLVDSLTRHGQFFPDEDGVPVFRPMSKLQAKPVNKFPHLSTDSLTGCVKIWEPPFKNSKGLTPPGMYKVVFDPYYMDGAEDKTSLFSIYVLKLPNPWDQGWVGLPVAGYTGRPESLETCYENLVAFCKVYNCTMQGEIAGGGKGVFDYLKTNDLLYLADYELESQIAKETGRAKKQRSYFISMPTERKRQGLSDLVQWHKRVRGIAEDGEAVYNVDRIYDIPFLLEMKKFREKGNFDRISAMIIGMMVMLEDTLGGQKRDADEKPKDSVLTRALFTDDEPNGEYITAL